jgi:hypothetical protein
MEPLKQLPQNNKSLPISIDYRMNNLVKPVDTMYQHNINRSILLSPIK